jgi:hypothetical protein
LSVPTAEPPAATLGARPPAHASVGRLFSGGRLYLWLLGLALVVGGLSLLIPSTPSYDPWAWLVWGREILHGSLHTPGGPTWKPLPVIFTTVFALFGGAQPFLWLVVARAGALLSVLMVFVLAARFSWGLRGPSLDGRRRLALAPAVVAGAIGVISLASTSGYVSASALGYSEGLMVAATLIALERHLDGHPRQAFVLGFVAALDRPEIWLFWGPYGLWLMWRDPGARALVIGLGVLTLFLWFVPQKWGSGSFTSGISRAQHPRSNSPAFAPCPFCAELKDHAWRLVILRVKLAAAIAVLVAGALLWRRRDEAPRRRTLVAVTVIGLFGLVWWLLVALETQAGFSGNDRYLVLGSALIILTGAVGYGWLGYELMGLLRRRFAGSAPPARRWVVPGLASGAAAVMTVVYLFAPNFVGPGLIDVQATHAALVYQANLRRDLVSLINRTGGPGAMKRCGSVMTEGFQVPMVAWYLNLRTLQVLDQPPTNAEGVAGTEDRSGRWHPIGPPNTILQDRDTRHAALLPTPATIQAWERSGAHYRFVIAPHHTIYFFQDCSL